MAGTHDRARVRLERSGGFAGVTLRTDVDSDDLDEEERQTFTDLLAGADTESLPSQSAPRPGQADRFQYDLSIDVAGRHYDFSYGEDSMPAQLRPLVDRMVEMARRPPSNDLGP